MQKVHWSSKPSRKMKQVLLVEQSHSQQTRAGRKQERAVFAGHAQPLILSKKKKNEITAVSQAAPREQAMVTGKEADSLEDYRCLPSEKSPEH